MEKSETVVITNLTIYYKEYQREYFRSHESYLIIPQLPVITAIWSRLAEAGVRIAFFLTTSIVIILFEELDKQITVVTENDGLDNSTEEMVWILEKSTEDYDSIFILVERINSFFGFILLLISGGDFLFAISSFSEIIENFTFTESFHISYYYSLAFSSHHQRISLQMSCFDFVYAMARYLLILVSSYRVYSSVIIF